MPEDLAPDTLGPDALSVDVAGFEGPLDFLLTLARTQKVDLRQISILALAEQYLAFVQRAKVLRIELAAEYLVMAAWLAFLKSKLLLPEEPDESGVSGAEMAAHLAFQLERLEAMRKAAAVLMARDQLGREFFARGAPERVAETRRVEWQASLLDLLQAYASSKTREAFEPLHLQRTPVLTMEVALERLRSLIGEAVEWRDLAAFLPPAWAEPGAKRRSGVAATFAAALEMVKSGRAELRQAGNFEPLELRQRQEEHAP